MGFWELSDDDINWNPNELTEDYVNTGETWSWCCLLYRGPIYQRKKNVARRRRQTEPAPSRGPGQEIKESKTEAADDAIEDDVDNDEMAKILGRQQPTPGASTERLRARARTIALMPDAPPTTADIRRYGDALIAEIERKKKLGNQSVYLQCDKRHLPAVRSYLSDNYHEKVKADWAGDDVYYYIVAPQAQPQKCDITGHRYRGDTDKSKQKGDNLFNYHVE